MTKLFDALYGNIQRKSEMDSETFNQYVEKCFLFALVWSIGCTVKKEFIQKIDYFIRDMEVIFPPMQTIFDYFVDFERMDFMQWDFKLQANWKPTTNNFSKINVPTVDSTKYGYVVKSLMESGSHVLLMGNTGVGKTLLIDETLKSQESNVSHFKINFSAGITVDST